MKISTVDIEQVPHSRGGGGSKAASLYTQLQDLKRGQALRVEFDNVAVSGYMRTKLAKIAKENGDTLGASREGDGSVRYFWIETA